VPSSRLGGSVADTGPEGLELYDITIIEALEVSSQSV
jgi:hypothetical protein